MIFYISGGNTPRYIWRHRIGLSTEKIRDKKINIGDVYNVDYQYDLISEYLKNNYLVDDDTMIKIKDVLKDLNSIIPEAEIQRSSSSKLNIIFQEMERTTGTPSGFPPSNLKS